MSLSMIDFILMLFFFISIFSQFQITKPNPSFFSWSLFQNPRIALKPTCTEYIWTVLGKKRMAEIIFGYTACRQLAQFFASIAFFHISEYLLAVAIHGRLSVSLSSLLISKQYVVAMVCSLLEYMLEIVLFPGLKEYWLISNIGLVMVVTGEIIRKTSIITACRAFTHNIKIHHEDHHKLVTHGIYRFIRHPGYCGFFIWSIATQIMLCNPISTVAFTVVTWQFFSTRIPYEEFFLRQFFGSQYEEYSRRVPSGVPFVK